MGSGYGDLSCLSPAAVCPACFSYGVLDGIFLNRRVLVLVPFGSDVRDVHVPHVLNRPSVGDLPWGVGSSVKKYQPSKTMYEKTGRTDRGWG